MRYTPLEVETTPSQRCCSSFRREMRAERIRFLSAKALRRSDKKSLSRAERNLAWSSIFNRRLFWMIVDVKPWRLSISQLISSFHLSWPESGIASGSINRLSWFWIASRHRSRLRISSIDLRSASFRETDALHQKGFDWVCISYLLWPSFELALDFATRLEVRTLECLRGSRNAETLPAWPYIGSNGRKHCG